MHGLIDDSFRDELNRMEMLRPENEIANLYFTAEKEAATAHIRIALEQAERYRADAVLFRIFPEGGETRPPIPQAYIYHEPSITFDESEYAEIHRRLWNAGTVLLIFILTAKEVKILNFRQEPEIDPATKEPVFTPFQALEKIVAIDRAFAARGISSGTLWESPKFKDDFALDKTAYSKLLSHLKKFRKELLDQKTISEPTVNRILVMAIMVKYLDERRDSEGNRVFEEGFLRQFSRAGKDNVEALFSEKGCCVRLFDHLSEHFNGGIFQLKETEKAELRGADLSLISDFLKGDREPDGQSLFWPLYSFEDLPVELISNVYEEFLAKKEGKDSVGVVYTPPMLVDFLIDQCLPLHTKTLSWKILDPACGSGVFLVGAFKRLIQCWRLENNWRKPSYRDLKTILKNSVFGIDSESESVLVTAFSLCVALCDELEPLVIWNKLKFDNLRGTNLQDRDFFEIIESGEFDNRFDLVIGNPPFANELPTNASERIEKNTVEKRAKLPDNQIALLFLKQSFRVARKEATVCMIQPAGTLLYNINAQNYREYLFGCYAINIVFDFTPLSGVFFKAQVATAAVIGYNAPSDEGKILHVIFRRTKTLKEKLLFELDPYDFHWVSKEAVARKPYVWKTNLLGGGRLHRMTDRLFTGTFTIGEYLEHKRENDGWQFGEGYNVGCGHQLNENPNANNLAKLSPKELMAKFKLKSKPMLAPWITGEVCVQPRCLTKEGIDWNSTEKVEALFFQRASKKSSFIFNAPHILIRKIVDGLVIPAAYTNRKAVFPKQIIGVYAPKNEKDQLKALAKCLNESKYFGILVMLVSGRILVGRDNSLNKGDIMALPFPDDNPNGVLSFWEQALVDDIEKYIVEFSRKGEAASVLHRASDSELRDFGNMYCDILNSVYQNFMPLEPVRLGPFLCYPFCYGDIPEIQFPEDKNIVPFLDELLSSRQGSRLFVHRVLRLYERNVVFMVKPDQKRYWLRSIAMRDADETFVDLLGQG